VGYRIRMAAEVAEWLAGLKDSDPATAELVDQALAALRDRGASLGPPLVIPVPPDEPVRPGPERAHRRLLEALTRLRRAVAQVATARKRLDLQIQQLELQAGKYEGQRTRARQMGREDLAEELRKRLTAIAAQLPELRDQEARFQAEEGHLTIASRRLQHKIDDIRTRWDATQAADLVTEASAEADQAEAAARDALASVGGAWQPEPASPPGTTRPGAPAPLPLSQLRPGAPGRSSVCILFTVEPAAPSAAGAGPLATATLLAAGTERDWLDAWSADAILCSRARYERDQGHPG
jgi:hypothetical protein